MPWAMWPWTDAHAALHHGPVSPRHDDYGPAALLAEHEMEERARAAVAQHPAADKRRLKHLSPPPHRTDVLHLHVFPCPPVRFPPSTPLSLFIAHCPRDVHSAVRDLYPVSQRIVLVALPCEAPRIHMHPPAFGMVRIEGYKTRGAAAHSLHGTLPIPGVKSQPWATASLSCPDTATVAAAPE